MSQLGLTGSLLLLLCARICFSVPALSEWLVSCSWCLDSYYLLLFALCGRPTGTNLINKRFKPSHLSVICSCLTGSENFWKVSKHNTHWHTNQSRMGYWSCFHYYHISVNNMKPKLTAYGTHGRETPTCIPTNRRLRSPQFVLVSVSEMVGLIPSLARETLANRSKVKPVD